MSSSALTQPHEYYMQAALHLADEAKQKGEVPVGAVVVKSGEIIGRGFNQPISGCDPTAHAEIIALRDAANNLDNYRLIDCDLYVTIEPCAMCAGAIVHSRIARVFYGATEPKAGVAESAQRFFERAELNHQVKIQGGVLANESREKIQCFFAEKRSSHKKFVEK